MEKTGFRRKAYKPVRLLPEWTWNHSKRKPIASYNPQRSIGTRKTAQTSYTIFSYNSQFLEEKTLSEEEACKSQLQKDCITWVNIDGLRKEEVEKICHCYGIHHLIAEDILSIGQRAKMDDYQDFIFCLLPMLYYNPSSGQVETEQVSIVLGSGFVLSFQEDPERDVFNPVRDRLRTGNGKLRQRSADLLCYSLIDVVVDSYFEIIEKLNDRIENLEDSLITQEEPAALEKISILRREVMLLRRSVYPVRDLVNGFLRSENELLEERHEKYYKDVMDHITQANEFVDNQREMLMNLQDLSMSQINTRMNQVMKIFTMVATLMAPATVIGGIFGMNFDIIPLAHQRDGFYISVGLMLVIPALMILWFRKKGWL